MQTKQHIQQLLKSAGIEPNKRLGQHFLIDLNLMRLLIDTANIHSNDIVLEVGCGTGSLTEALAQKACRVIAVELDETVAEIAQKELADYPNTQVINADVLESKHLINRDVTKALESARNNCTGRILLVANLPYSVASVTILNLVTGNITADAIYATVQKEVAQRMTAIPGSGDYGVLSICLAATGSIKIERFLKPTVFWPQPQVDSAMVSFIRRKKKVSQIKNMQLFSKVVNLFMQHRRKMLKGCVKFADNQLATVHNWTQIFEHSCIDPHLRPEELAPEDFLAIANLCHEHINKTG